jgi:hypothetical protein
MLQMQQQKAWDDAGAALQAWLASPAGQQAVQQAAAMGGGRSATSVASEAAERQAAETASSKSGAPWRQQGSKRKLYDLRSQFSKLLDLRSQFSKFSIAFLNALHLISGGAAGGAADAEGLTEVTTGLQGFESADLSDYWLAQWEYRQGCRRLTQMEASSSNLTNTDKAAVQSVTTLEMSCA